MARGKESSCQCRSHKTHGELQVWSLGWEDPPEEEMVTHSRILAGIIPWTEKPGRLQSVYELTKSWTWLSMHTYTHASIKRWSQADIIAWSQHPCFRSFQILERGQYVCFTLIMQCFKDSGIAPHEKTFRCKNTISLLIPSWIKHINYLMCFHICFLTWQGLFFFTF